MIDLEPRLRHSDVVRRRSIFQLGVRLFLFVSVLRPWMRESIIVALMVVLLATAFGVDFSPDRNMVAENIALALLFGLMGVWTYLHRAAFATWAQNADLEATGTDTESRTESQKSDAT